ncbi:MAG: hypothetical protein M1358_25865 [Chloroflexi bacterium]|nr:hypothetical protein [Chloroflexota bacterium]
MVTLYKANEGVGGGTYLNLKQGDFINIEEEGGILPGTADVTYVKVPAPAMLVLGPILGLMFVIFLPMAVPLVLMAMLAKKLGLKVEGAREAAMQMTVPAQVGVAAVHRRRGKQEKEVESSQADLDDLITQLEQEIAERRKNGQ